MMGLERGRLAVALDLLTDSLILVGQHGVYCASSRNPSKPALDLQAVLGGMDGAKQLIQSVMEEMRKSREKGTREQRNRGRRSGSLESGRARPPGNPNAICLKSAPVAQLDRANASGALGREFESLRAHHIYLFAFPHKHVRGLTMKIRAALRLLFLGFACLSTLGAGGCGAECRRNGSGDEKAESASLLWL